MLSTFHPTYLLGLLSLTFLPLHGAVERPSVRGSPGRCRRRRAAVR